MSLVGSTKGVRFLGCLSWVLPLGMCLMFAFGGSGQCFWRFANWVMGWNGWRQVGHTCVAVNGWFVECRVWIWICPSNDCLGDGHEAVARTSV